MLVGVVMLGCSPTLDWREVRPEGSAALLLFPCKPRSQVRVASLAASRVVMTMVACNVGDVTYALSYAELGDPSRVTDALVELRSALVANVDASEVHSAAFEWAGMTPNPQAMLIRVRGHLPDGTLVQEKAALFARGTRVYQVAMLGARLDEVAAGAFFESLSLAQ
jgi:hypothetical protein